MLCVLVVSAPTSCAPPADLFGRPAGHRVGCAQRTPRVRLSVRSRSARTCGFNIPHQMCKREIAPFVSFPNVYQLPIDIYIIVQELLEPRVSLVL